MNATIVTGVTGPDTAPGRSEVIREVYQANVERIYRFAYFKLGNREDAEDVTSQVFIKAAVWLDTSQDPRTMLAWLYQVTRTLISDYWRGYFKRLTTSLDQMEECGAPELVAAPVYLGAGPEDDLACDVEKIGRAMALLPENYRQVLELRFLRGYSLKDTALALGLKEGNVRVLQHRGLRKAASILQSL